MISRRDFISTTSTTIAATVLTHGCTGRSLPPATSSTAPEVTTARLGFVPLLDAAPLIVAQEKDYFAKYGIPGVELVPEMAWETIQRSLTIGSESGGLDGAHLPSPLPYFMAMGKTADSQRTPMYVLARLNLNGQAILLANIFKDLHLRTDSTDFKTSVEKAKATGPGMRLKIGITSLGGTHDLWMRYWLAAGNINPDTDVAMVVVPAAQMVANMQTGTLHAFCVGEPWASQLVEKRFGYAAVTTAELWQDHPEKVFAIRAPWVDKYPKAAKALLMAIQEAQIWCDTVSNQADLCSILSTRFRVPAPVLLPQVQGNLDLGSDRRVDMSVYRTKFWSDSASYPYRSHDAWFLTESIRWGYLTPLTDIKAVVDKVNREDLWREAATAIGQAAAIPPTRSRGIETFFDDRRFNFNNPKEYLNDLPIKKKWE